MNRYSLTHLSNGELLRNLSSLVARDRATTADLLAHIVEVDERRLWAAAGCSSMHGYCVEKLRLSEDAAAKRIHVARKARRFPVLFEAIADGRLSLSGADLLAAHLTAGCVTELIAEATHKTNRQIENLLAVRFPRPDLPTVIVAIPVAAAAIRAAVGMEDPSAGAPADNEAEHAVRHVETGAGAASSVAEPSKPLADRAIPPTGPDRPRMKPLSAAKYGLQVTIDQETHDLLRRAQELLGHQVPAGDVPEVLRRALRELVAQLEKRKFGATSRPRAAESSRDPRHIPAHVKRAVWTRDQGRCAFVGDNGHRCEARRGLEFDHVIPVAKGGESTVANVRLLCRAHNQLEAERELGHALMKGRRDAAAEARPAERRARTRSPARAAAGEALVSLMPKLRAPSSTPAGA